MVGATYSNKSMRASGQYAIRDATLRPTVPSSEVEPDPACSVGSLSLPRKGTRPTRMCSGFLESDWQSSACTITQPDDDWDAGTGTSEQLCPGVQEKTLLEGSDRVVALASSHCQVVHPFPARSKECNLHQLTTRKAWVSPADHCSKIGMAAAAGRVAPVGTSMHIFRNSN